ncbi:hypothetical protein [Magnetospirillum sp. 64-120]|uniref:hypothetical protein n=1 Tax=Magnetospirillum sp. 64-120 TaxID=1895778 RepID=UPI000927CCAA|nr:hypothetical protein [Magnetospirillum sp. 64-120]OJX68199.1 MAG: hypothetical protein BGO92_05975 [Magnetospirillum sp. 64-120]
MTAPGFRPRGCIALDILPKQLDIAVADAEGLTAALATLPVPATIGRDSVFGLVDLAVWKDLLRQ